MQGSRAAWSQRAICIIALPPGSGLGLSVTARHREKLLIELQVK